MTPSAITLAQLLTYGGTLPLVACALAPLAGLGGAVIAGSYSAVIVSFLCGIHWAAHLFFAERCPRNLLVTSNAVALLAWLSLLMGGAPPGLLLLALCFLYLLALDVKLRDAGILPAWFFRLRRNATVIVVLCLSVIMGSA